MIQDSQFSVAPGMAYVLHFTMRGHGAGLGVVHFALRFADAAGRNIDTRTAVGADTQTGIVPALNPITVEVWPAALDQETCGFDTIVRRYVLVPPDATTLAVARVDAEKDTRDDTDTDEGGGGSPVVCRIDIYPVTTDWTLTGSAGAVRVTELAACNSLAAQKLDWLDGRTAEDDAARATGQALFAVPALQYAALMDWFAPAGDWSPVLDRLQHSGGDLDDYILRIKRLTAQSQGDLPVVGFAGSARGRERLEGFCRLVWLDESNLDAQLAATPFTVIVIESALASGLTQTGWSLAFSSLDGSLPAAGRMLLDAAARGGVPVHLWLTGDPANADLWHAFARQVDRVIAESDGWGDIAVDMQVPRGTEPAAGTLASPVARCGDLMLVPVAADVIHDPEFAALLAGGSLYRTLFTEFRYAFNRHGLRDRLGNADVPVLTRTGRAEQRTLLGAATIVLLNAAGPRSDVELVEMAIDAIACGAVPVLFGAPRGDDALLAALDRVATRAALMTLQGLYRIGWCRETRWRSLMAQVMAGHVWTGADRAAVLGRDAMFTDFDTPKVSVVLVTKRPHLLRRCFETFRRQDWPHAELILVFNAKDVPQDIPDLRDNERVFALPEAASLGECLNRGIAVAQGRYWCKMDDDDYYSRSYLSETVTYYRATQADIVGRQSGFFYFDGRNETVSRDFVAERSYALLQPGYSISGATLSAATRWDGPLFSLRHRSHADADWVSRVNRPGTRIFSAGFTDMVVYRDAVAANHTWQMNASIETGKRYLTRADGNMFNIFERWARVEERAKSQARITLQTGAYTGAGANTSEATEERLLQDDFVSGPTPDTAISVQIDTLYSAYLTLRQQYDTLEERLVQSQRQDQEAQIAALDSLQAKLTATKDTADKLRLRLKDFEERRARHLAERIASRAIIATLREALTAERRSTSEKVGSRGGTQKLASGKGADADVADHTSKPETRQSKPSLSKAGTRKKR